MPHALPRGWSRLLLGMVGFLLPLGGQSQDPWIGPDGALYIADTGRDRIRRVDLWGTITTIAGVGTRGKMGEEGPALKAQLNHPAAIAYDADGNLLFSDSYTSIIRKVVLVAP